MGKVLGIDGPYGPPVKEIGPPLTGLKAEIALSPITKRAAIGTCAALPTAIGTLAVPSAILLGRDGVLG